MTIQELSAAGRHQECLQACQTALQVNPEESYAYKYAGKSLLALGQVEKAQECLVKAHELDGSDPEIAKDIGNIFLNLGNQNTALGWYEKALEINNNYGPAINNLANLKRQSGKNQEAVDLYKRAIQVDPRLIQAYVGAAASFLTLGDLDQAESFAAQAIAINESAPGINEILGLVFQNKNDIDQAIECYQKELEINPQASNSLLNFGCLLLQKGQTAAAVESLLKASTLAPSEQCSLLLAQAYKNLGQFKEAIIEYKKLDINKSQNKMIPFNLGLCALENGDNNAAIEAFKIAIQLDESFIPAWGNIGSALMNKGRYQEALQATIKVLDLDPVNPDALINLGSIYQELGQLDQALASTLKSLELIPDNPDALMNMWAIYKHLDNSVEANKAIQKCFRSNKITLPQVVQAFDYFDSTNQQEKLMQAMQTVDNLFGHDNIATALYRARLLYHEKAYDLSLKALAQIDINCLVDSFMRCKYFFFRGLSEEKTGLYDEAFNHFILAQRDNRYRSISPLYSSEIINLYVSLSEKIKPISVACSHPTRSPVFLVGFPRSGTTLLDIVLRSHPSVEVVEEKDQLASAEHIAISEFGKKIADFADLDVAHLDRLRDVYWERLRAHTKDPRKMIVDKLPLNIIKMPLINLLFPNAKIILAIRHPCDSVLSCFQQLFEPNSAMANFTSLAGSVHLYDKVMTAWNGYCDCFPVHHHLTRYEDLIEDFDGTMSKLISFLDIEWSESIKDYRSTALKRGSINTPSATQVTQTLYKTSIGKWKNYERYFDEYLPLLDPWMKQWGYK